MISKSIFLVVLFILAGPVTCEEEAKNTKKCKPGDTKTCVCSDKNRTESGAAGVSTCEKEGNVWSECHCIVDDGPLSGLEF